MDHFGWTWSCAKRFGLMHVDCDTLRRTLKNTTQGYRRHVQNWREGIGMQPWAPASHRPIEPGV